MNLSNLIAQAVANRKYNQRADGSMVLSYMSSAAEDTPHGRVVCFADHTVRNPNSRSGSKHVRLTFDLNGKRVSRAALEVLA